MNKKIILIGIIFILLNSILVVGIEPTKVNLGQHSKVTWNCPNSCIEYQDCFFNDQSQNICVDMKSILEKPECRSCLSLDSEFKEFVDNNWNYCGLGRIFVEDKIKCLLELNNAYDAQMLKFYASIKLGYSSSSNAFDSICNSYINDLGIYWGCLDQRKKAPECLYDYITWQQGYGFGTSLCANSKG